MGTTLSDVIVPELFTPYVIQRTMELSTLFNSGIVERNAEFDRLASEAAPVHTMPFFADLTGDPEDVVEGADLTAAGIESKTDVSTTIRRAKMWSSTDLAAAMAGSDPMKAIGDLVAGFWARSMQKELVSELKGIFASESMADHVLNISGNTGVAANISATSFFDALQKMGDAADTLTAVAMHSATKTYLMKQNLITTQRDSSDASFDVYQGRRVVVDDGCPVADGVYTTYLFGERAVAFGEGSPVGFVPTETTRDPKKGSGVDYLINRHTFILHPRGIKWTNKTRAHAETVSRKEMEDGTNWERAYESKAIRVVALVHKIG